MTLTVNYGKIAVSSKCHRKEQITNQAETNQRLVYQHDSYLFMAGASRCMCIFIAHSPHVETVCLLSNRKPDTKVRIDVDLEDYYRIKDAKKNQN